MAHKKYTRCPINKQSETLFLTFKLMGYDHYEGPATKTANTYKYYILTPEKGAMYHIYIHKHKARFHTTRLPNNTKCFADTKITKQTLTLLANIWTG